MDHIRAAEFAQQQWPVAELRHDRADVLDPQERVEWLRRNRIDWNNPRVDVGVVRPSVQQPLRLDRLAAKNSERRDDDRNAKTTMRGGHIAGSVRPVEVQTN